MTICTGAQVYQNLMSVFLLCTIATRQVPSTDWGGRLLLPGSFYKLVSMCHSSFPHQNYGA